MRRQTTQPTPTPLARRTGVAYLGIIAAGIFAEFVVRGVLVVADDPIATADNIASSPALFGVGIASDVVMIALDIAVAIGLFRLLQHVDRTLAVTTTVLRFVQAIVLTLNLVNLARALTFARDALGPNGGVLRGPAEDALAAVEAHALGYDIGLIAFGLSCIALARLLMISDAVPRLLAVGMSAAGVVYIGGSIVALVAPSWTSVIEPIYLIPFVAELAFAIRLVTRGLDVPVQDGLEQRARMRAVVQDRYGSTDALSVRSVERPDVADDEVLVRVVSAGVDRGVWHRMTGRPYITRTVFGLSRPRDVVLGTDLAGVVESVGAAVSRFVEGDLVFGTGRGTFADFAAASQDALAAIPHGVCVADSGALAASGSTALQAVEDHGHVQAGQEVLVLGASGGVGSYAVQIAAARGATVTGTASGTKLDLVHRAGAHHVVDHGSTDPLSDEARYDVIIDAGGSRRLRDLRRALTPTGRVVIVGGEGGGRWLGGADRLLRARAMSLVGRRRLISFVASEDADHLERLADLVGDGLVAPMIDVRVALADAAVAMRRLESGHARGKILIDVDGCHPNGRGHGDAMSA